MLGMLTVACWAGGSSDFEFWNAPNDLGKTTVQASGASPAASITQLPCSIWTSDSTVHIGTGLTQHTRDVHDIQRAQNCTEPAAMDWRGLVRRLL